jgi:hypothetical protein
VQKIEVIKNKDDYRKQTERAREARQTNRDKRNNERLQMEEEDKLSNMMREQEAKASKAQRKASKKDAKKAK